MSQQQTNAPETNEKITPDYLASISEAIQRFEQNTPEQLKQAIIHNNNAEINKIINREAYTDSDRFRDTNPSIDEIQTYAQTIKTKPRECTAAYIHEGLNPEIWRCSIRWSYCTIKQLYKQAAKIPQLLNGDILQFFNGIIKYILFHTYRRTDTPTAKAALEFQGINSTVYAQQIQQKQINTMKWHNIKHPEYIIYKDLLLDLVSRGVFLNPEVPRLLFNVFIASSIYFNPFSCTFSSLKLSIYQFLETLDKLDRGGYRNAWGYVN